jgi:hypothetical protein
MATSLKNQDQNLPFEQWSFLEEIIELFTMLESVDEVTEEEEGADELLL